MQHRAIRHVLGQRVLEDVFHLGKRRLFIQKLFALEGYQNPVQGVFGQGDHSLDQPQGKRPADDRKLLEQGFLIGRQPVNPGGKHALDRR